MLDLSVVSALAVDLDSPREALEFLGRFEELLSWRVHIICDAIASRDVEQTAAALTSLHTHALTIGALQLHAITGQALADIHHKSHVRAVDVTTLTATRTFLHDLIQEAILFKHAYTALCSNPTLLDLRGC